MNLMPKEEFSRTASMDVRGAMAATLASYIAGLKFEALDGGTTLQFAEVFDEWPSYLDRAVPPSGCVLPSSWKYGAAVMTPVLIERTWEPKGQAGWGLWKTGEAEVEFEFSFRTTSTAERGKLILGIEDAFQSTSHEANRIVLEMPAYYGLDVRYSLLSCRVVDSEDQAMKEQRDAVMTISAQADKVALKPVFPMSLTIKKVDVGATPLTIS